MTCHSTHRDRMSFALANALIKPGNVLWFPVRVLVVTGDSIGGFDESPFEVVVGLWRQMAIPGFSSTALHRRYRPSVAGQLFRTGKALDRSDLASDDDAQDVAHSGKGF